MLELLAALQSADPMSLALWAVIAFAAGMYPVGIMLGAPCSPCCGCGCEPGESLPEYITANFSGVSKSINSPISLLSLSIEADFGSGATGTVEGTLPGTGPIQSVSLTNGGSGYARLNRTAPTLTASSTPGSGATFTVTTEKVNAKLFYWKITDITVSGGTGYQYGSPVTISLAEGDVEEVAAIATLATGREPPTLTADNTSGTGAVLSVAVTANIGSSPATWGVDAITVTDGGENYDDDTLITITLGTGDVETTSATAYIRTTRIAPTLSAAVQSSTGTGATVSITLDTITDLDGRPLWLVSELPVGDGGEGYAVGDEIPITLVEGIGGASFTYGVVSSVDENGAVTGTQVIDGGLFFKDSGVIESVVIGDRGEYFHDTGVPQSVTVEDGGKYYHEDPTQPVLVADVTVTINQQAPSDGSGAVVTAVVNADKNSAEFGQITALTLEDGGSGYQAFDYETNATACCGDWWNDTTFTLRRATHAEIFGYGDDGCCWYTTCDTECCRWVHVRYCGTDKPPRVYTGPTSPGSCSTTFYASPDDAPFYCDGLSFTATDPFGATVTVSATEQSCEEASSQCPPCCAQFGSTNESTPASFSAGCTSGDCVSPYTWGEGCYCGNCVSIRDSCLDLEFLVVAKMVRYLAGPPKTKLWEKETTFTLNSGNDWNDTRSDFEQCFVPLPTGYSCGINAQVVADQANGTNGYKETGAAGGKDRVGLFMSLPTRTRSDDNVCPFTGATTKQEQVNPYQPGIFGTGDYVDSVAGPFLNDLEVSVTLVT